jgi:hypothetical protein
MVAELSVVIVNWREVEQTLRCVSSLRCWRTLKPELCVVDNESTEASRKALGTALDRNELVCSQANLGYAGGNNLGIAGALRSGTPFILLLNSDAAIAEKDVIRLLNRLRGNPGIGILGPVLRERQQDSGQCYIGGKDIVRNTLTRQAARLGDLHCVPGYPLNEVDYVPGTVFLARREVFKQIGLLDEKFFFSGEIADFCKRARDSGNRVCVDLEVEARHDASDAAQTRRETLYVYYSLRNRFLYAKKHYPLQRAKYFGLWSKLCLVELGRALAGGKLRKARAILLAVEHGCTGRFGNQNTAFFDGA